MVGSDYKGDNEMTIGYKMRSALGRDMGSMMVSGRILSTLRDGQCILIESRLCSMLLLIQQEPSSSTTKRCIYLFRLEKCGFSYRIS